MRKDRDGEKNGKKRGGEKRGEKEKTDENSGHYVIASGRPPERRPLERRTLVPTCSPLSEGVTILLTLPLVSSNPISDKSVVQCLSFPFN